MQEVSSYIFIDKYFEKSSFHLLNSIFLNYDIVSICVQSFKYIILNRK